MSPIEEAVSASVLHADTSGPRRQLETHDRDRLRVLFTGVSIIAVDIYIVLNAPLGQVNMEFIQ